MFSVFLLLLVLFSIFWVVSLSFRLCGDLGIVGNGAFDSIMTHLNHFNFHLEISISFPCLFCFGHLQVRLLYLSFLFYPLPMRHWNNSSSFLLSIFNSWSRDWAWPSTGRWSTAWQENSPTSVATCGKFFTPSRRPVSLALFLLLFVCLVLPWIHCRKSSEWSRQQFRHHKISGSVFFKSGTWRGVSVVLYSLYFLWYFEIWRQSDKQKKKKQNKERKTY